MQIRLSFRCKVSRMWYTRHKGREKMIDFQKITPADAPMLRQFLLSCNVRSCEYSLANLSMWGRQRFAFLEGFLVLFSQFDRQSIYPFPLGHGDVKPVLEALIQDARDRGLLFRLSSMTHADCDLLESLYPGQFQFHEDRNSCDYIYRIEDLVLLKGKRYQSKRNFANRFRLTHPDCLTLPLDERTEKAAWDMLQTWFAQRSAADPLADLHLEQRALQRAFAHREELGLEGMVLIENGKVLAMTMGSLLSENTFDIHFEKALDICDGAYAAINNGFARYLREKYPDILWLNREEDMGIEGLRKAKLSYNPHHLMEKSWACLLEDGYDY